MGTKAVIYVRYSSENQREVSLEDHEFDHNGSGDGLTHNLYVGNVALLQVHNSSFHDALGGHEIKSRAQRTIVMDSRIADGPTAQTSYSVDLPNGGKATIAHNVIEKGPNTPNSSIIHFGGESFPVYANSAIAITGNTVINDRAGVNFVLNQSQNAVGLPIIAKVNDNTFYGLTAAQLGNDLLAVNNRFLTGAPPAALPGFAAAITDVPAAVAPTIDPLLNEQVFVDIRGSEFFG